MDRNYVKKLNSMIEKGQNVVVKEGKDGVERSIIEKIDSDYIAIALRDTMDLGEVKGFPEKEVPPLWLLWLQKACKKNPDKKHIVLVEGLSDVRPAIQSQALDAVFDLIGKSNDLTNCVVVATGASEDYAIYDIPENVMKKFDRQIVITEGAFNEKTPSDGDFEPDMGR